MNPAKVWCFHLYWPNGERFGEVQVEGPDDEHQMREYMRQALRAQAAKRGHMLVLGEMHVVNPPEEPPVIQQMMYVGTMYMLAFRNAMRYIYEQIKREQGREE